MSVQKVVIHTDILLEYLLQSQDEHSVLREAMRLCFCYTTVFNAIELFSLARTEREYNSIGDAMSAMKILGLNAKNAKRYGELNARYRCSRMNILIAGLALESKLPILTSKPKEFRAVRGLTLLQPKDIGIR